MSYDHAETEKTNRLTVVCIVGAILACLLIIAFASHEERANAHSIALECVKHHSPDRCEKLVEALP